MAMNICIRALRPNGFRRCGVFHPAQEVNHSLERFTEDEWRRLMAEPHLVCVPVDVDEEDEPDGESEANTETVDNDGAGTTATTTDPTATPPTDPAERMEAIKAAIREESFGEAENFTTAGTPKVDRIEFLLGWGISAEERDAAWQAIQAESDSTN